MTSELTKACTRVDAARAKFESLTIELRKAEAVNRTAQGAAADERYEKNLILSRGGPRSAPGVKLPATALETAAAKTEQMLDAVRGRHMGAQAELASAEAQKLVLENKIINRWRDLRALEYRQLERDDAPPEVLAAKIAELRGATPHEMQVRIHQRFTVSALVRELLAQDDPAANGLRINTPGPILRGEVGGAAYEKIRARILAEAEDESSPLEAA